MNKIAKASIAGAAGVILLMGGAGSLAYWNNSQSLGSNGQSIVSGELKAAAVNAGSWTTAFNNGTATTGLVAKIVPGDELTFTQAFTVTASGDNLKYRVAVSAPAVTGALAGKLVPTGAFTINTGSGAVAGSASTSYTPSTGTTTVTITQKYTWAFGTVAPTSNTTEDNAAQNATYTLPTTGNVTLTQVSS